MKLISRDRSFLYYICDRADGKSHGVRISRSTGVTGFVSDTPTAQQAHPVRFTVYDNAVKLPIRGALPPIAANAVGDIENEHPEIHDLLEGQITLEDALNRG